MDESRISSHTSVKTAYKRIKEDDLTNIWDRFEAQGPRDPDKRCAFCMGGFRCYLSRFLTF